MIQIVIIGIEAEADDHNWGMFRYDFKEGYVSMCGVGVNLKLHYLMWPYVRSPLNYITGAMDSKLIDVMSCTPC